MQHEEVRFQKQKQNTIHVKWDLLGENHARDNLWVRKKKNKSSLRFKKVNFSEIFQSCIGGFKYN